MTEQDETLVERARAERVAEAWWTEDCEMVLPMPESVVTKVREILDQAEHLQTATPTGSER